MHPRQQRWPETVSAAAHALAAHSLAAYALAALRSPLGAVLLVAVIIAFVVRRVPVGDLANALAGADHLQFLAVMVANTVVLFCSDTFVLSCALRWFHRRMPFGELFAARAAAYVVLFFSTNAARGALALYLSRRLHVPLLSLLGTIVFVVLTEYLHLFIWAAAALVDPAARLPGAVPLLPVLGALLLLGLLWYIRGGRGRDRDDDAPIGQQTLSQRMRALAVLQTVRTATVSQYLQVIAVLVPALFVSICSHYFAAAAFGLEIPLAAMVTLLPWVSMVMAMPFTIGSFATIPVAWLVLFGAYGTDARLLALGLAANLTLVLTRTALGLVCLPRAHAHAVRSLGTAS